MNTDKEISSTEKLLKTIRNKDDSLTSGDQAPSLVTAANIGPKKRNFAQIIPFQKSVTVGVDIGFDSLRLVKILHFDSSWKLLDYKHAALAPQISSDSPEFADFLKSQLDNFCGRTRKTAIWSAVSIANADVRHINIPKVPKKQIANVVYWKAKKELQFDEKETVFDFEVKGMVSEKGSSQLSVMVYTAPRSEIEGLKKLFAKCDFPLTGISIAPFAIQNLFRTKWISTSDETVAMLYIGRELSQIDIFFKNSLALTRGIRTGIHSMVDTLVETKGKPSMDISQAEKALSSIQNDSPSPLSLTKEEIFNMILPAVERLVRQTERTFEYYSATLKKKPATRIYINGHMAAYKPLVEYVSKELGVTANMFDPLKTASNLSENVVIPSSVSKRIVFSRAVGLALSNNYRTPNLLFTYKEKKKAKDIAFINKGLFTVFILIMSIGIGLFLWQKNLANIKAAKATEKQQELDSLGPLLDRNLVFRLAANAKQQHKKNKMLSKKYIGMGVISELIDVTHHNIRLLSMDIDLGSYSKKPSDTKNGKQVLVLDGFIYGNQELFESTLAGYLMRLVSSPLFRLPEVTKNELEFSYKYGEILHFILNIQLERE